MDRFSRIAVLISAFLCLALQAVLGARAWAPLSEIALATFLVAFVLGRFAPKIGSWVVLLPAYVLPLILLVASGRVDPAYSSVWASGLLGLIVGTSGLAGWAVPMGWRLPLALWGLSVVLSWPIVVWRELDFTPALLNQYHLAVTHSGNPPPVEITWIARVAGIHLVGLLWIDGLFRAFADKESRRFERAIAWPLAVSALLMIGLALYQMFVDITRFNVGVFGSLGRVSGAILDGNACGMVAAIWAVGWIALTARRHRAVALIATGAASAAFALVVWGSGSRTALFAAFIGFAVLMFSGVLSGRRLARRLVITVAVVAVLGAAAFLFTRSRSAAVGPLSRMSEFFSNGRLHGIPKILEQLWNRNAYGQVSTGMILELPLTGGGVGTFESLSVDYARVLYNFEIPPDDAQNWFREQLAEFGVLGSVGWIVWVALLVAFLVRRVPASADAWRARVVKGIIVAFGLASCLRMVSQSPELLITFWTLVFWAVALTGSTASVGPVVAHPARWWRIVWALAIVFAAATAVVGVTRLRVPFRALRADWGYAYGFYDLERPATPDAFWWTRQKSVSVISADGRFLKLTFWVSHPDLGTRPVRVKIWNVSQLIFDEDVSTSAPIVRYIRLPEGALRAMIETWVSRTWSPAERGANDWRQLGLGLGRWTFVDAPPEGATVIK